MARIVIEVSDQHKQLVNALQQFVEVVVAIDARSSGGKAIDYAQIERDLGAAAAQIEREAHRGILAALDVDAAKVRISGAPYSRVGRYASTYYTMAGAVVVERAIYRRDGERNGKVVDVISLQVSSRTAGCRRRRARWSITSSEGLRVRPKPARSKRVGWSTRAAASSVSPMPSVNTTASATTKSRMR